MRRSISTLLLSWSLVANLSAMQQVLPAIGSTWQGSGGGGGSAPTVVNHTSNESVSASCAMTLSVTAGNTLLVGGLASEAPNTITVSDGTNTYTQVEAAFSDSSNATTQKTFTAPVTATNAALSITVSFSSSTNWQDCWAVQLSGSGISVDKTADASNTATTTWASGTTATTTQANELLVGIFSTKVTGSNPFTVGASWTQIENFSTSGGTNTVSFLIEDQTVAVTGAYQATATNTGAVTGSAVIVALK